MSETPHDDLCRPLTVSEKQWLAQVSLICIAARLSPELSRCVREDKKVRDILSLTRSMQPFLSVCIDASALNFARSSEITLTTQVFSEEDTMDTEDALRSCIKHQLSLGLDREVGLARVHILHHSRHSYLLLIGDHLCFDGRSLMWWLSEITASLLPSTESASHLDRAMLEFSDWTTKIPSMEFAPFIPPFTSIKMSPKADIPPMEVMVTMEVDDVVVTITKTVLHALKERAAAQSTTLNAPLQIAFLAAATDTALWRNSDLVAPLNVRCVCAVDLRTALHLPGNYMNTLRP
jgi:hypothetical protein